MKKKIIITITIIIIIIVAVLSFIFITKKEPKQTESQNSYNLKQKETLKLCKSNDCRINRDITIDEISYNTDKKEIKKAGHIFC